MKSRRADASPSPLALSSFGMVSSHNVQCRGINNNVEVTIVEAASLEAHGELISRITGHFNIFSFWRTAYRTVPYGTV